MATVMLMQQPSKQLLRHHCKD